jgi:hypothetical protein
MILRHAAVLLILAAGLTRADDPERGRLLYENYCYHCHLSEIHYRVGSRMDSLERLRHTVRIWQGEMGLGWSEDDVRDVSSFLNARYYGLPGAVPRRDHERPVTR